MLTVIVARERPDGNLQTMFLLLDLWKKGIRECFVDANLPKKDLDRQCEKIGKSYHSVDPPVHEPVPDPQLWFDAAQSDGKGSWKNLGAAGGAIPGGAMHGASTPTFEPASIGQPARYTAMNGGDSFGGLRGTTPVFCLGKDWTVEIGLKRNGAAYGNEHHILGFQAYPREEVQSIRVRLGTADGKIGVAARGKKSGDLQMYIDTGLDIGLNTWHRIAFVHTESDRKLRSYMDGRLVSEHSSELQFAPEVDIELNTIFTNSWEERHRNFNGSINTVRVYSRAVNDADILANFESEILPIEQIEFAECQKLTRHALDIATEVKTEIPWEFHYWREILGDLSKVPPTEGSLYKCPKCGEDLPQSAVDLIKQHAQSDDIQFYILCRKCGGEFD
jgi:hypothetical protein